jgi:hypothetical protein
LISCGGGGRSGGVGGRLGIVETFPDIPQLYIKEYELPAANQNQKESNRSQCPGRYREPPLVRRMLICAALFIFDLGLAFWGWENLHRKRDLIGSTLIGVG